MIISAVRAFAPLSVGLIIAYSGNDIKPVFVRLCRAHGRGKAGPHGTDHPMEARFFSLWAACRGHASPSLRFLTASSAAQPHRASAAPMP